MGSYRIFRILNNNFVDFKFKPVGGASENIAEQREIRTLIETYASAKGIEESWALAVSWVDNGSVKLGKFSINETDKTAYCSNLDPAENNGNVECAMRILKAHYNKYGDKGCATDAQTQAICTSLGGESVFIGMRAAVIAYNGLELASVQYSQDVLGIKGNIYTILSSKGIN